jgi:hypothetical protein
VVHFLRAVTLDADPAPRAGDDEDFSMLGVSVGTDFLSPFGKSPHVDMLSPVGRRCGPPSRRATARRRRGQLDRPNVCAGQTRPISAERGQGSDMRTGRLRALGREA